MIVASFRPIERIVIADAAGAPGEVDTELQRRGDAAAADGNRRARRRRLIAVADALQRPRLRIRHEAIAVHRDRVDRTQVAEPLRVGPLADVFAKPINSNAR